MIVYIFLGAALLVIIYLFATFNSFIKLRNSVKEAFSTMDVYLKKRWDLIPNLVESVKGYVKHEGGVLESVVSLRNLSYDKMSSHDKIETNEKLTSGLSRLMAISENYPDLKASQNFTDLNSQLAKIEDDISNSRKYYNAVVKQLNTKIEMIPSNFVAMMFGFKQAEMFEAQAGEREAVKVNFQ
jgi:LemA protein